MNWHGAAGSRRGMTLLALIALAGFAAITPGTRSGAAQSTPDSATPAAGETIELLGLVQNPGPLSVADLQALPGETIEVTYESGGSPEGHTFTGVRLFDVLEHVGIAADPATHHPLLRRSLIVTANDGYQIVLSGGELDPNFGNAPMLLAWEQDGAPLVGDDGPLRLVAPGDLRGGRYVRGVVSIEVVGITEPAA